MGNKAAGGPFQLEHAESPGFHVGTMSGNEVRDEGCASEGSGDDERVYVSPAEVDEAEAVAVAPSDEQAEDAVNFTRNNSQSSMSKNRPPGSPAEGVAAVGEPVSGPVAATEQRPPEPVPAPPRAPLSASASVSPPRAPGTSDLQLPPLNDPHPPPALEEARLDSRGSPNSVDGRDQKGAQ